ncbi:response regulator [Planctomycetota bacterium]
MSARKFLCVDDEEVVRRVIQRIFCARSEEVSVLDSAADAIEALTKQSYDLVITDIRMDGGGGKAVAEAAGRAGIPVLFITGYAESGSVQDFIDAGAPVVRKPFTAAQLVETIEELMERSS